MFRYKIVRMQNISDFILLIGMGSIRILIIQDNTYELIHKKHH